MDEYYKNYELVARALEIAIKLTKADDTWLGLDSNKNVVIDEPLFSTVRNVAQILSDVSIIAVRGNTRVFSGKDRRADKT